MRAMMSLPGQQQQRGAAALLMYQTATPATCEITRILAETEPAVLAAVALKRARSKYGERDGLAHLADALAAFVGDGQ